MTNVVQRLNREFVPNITGTFRLVPGETQTWLVRCDVPNMGDHIYVTDPEPGAMRGFGGRQLIFALEQGGVYSADGPWHSNGNALFKDTGLDIRDLHMTRVVLTAQDGTVIYHEDEPLLGPFDRGEQLARALARVRREPVQVYSSNAGGSSTKWIKP